MRRPRILIDAISSSTGGGLVWQRSLFQELARDSRGFRFTVLAAPDVADVLPVETLEVRIPRRPRPLGLAARLLYLELAAPRVAGRFDLFFSPVDFAPPLRDTPLVVTGQNLNIFDRSYYATLRLRITYRLARRSMLRADRVVVPSRAAAEAIERAIGLPRDRARVVHYGVDASSLLPHRGDADPPYLFLPAAPERHKNIETLVRSVRHLDDPRLEVWLGGASEADPEHAGRLRSLAREEGVAERVRFLGRLPREDVARCYEGARAVVFPSKLESFGLPLLESLSVGVPLVASDIPVCREIAADAALYFAADDPVALARSVHELRANSAATKQRVEIGRRLAADFTWARTADRLCDLFEEVLRRRGRGRFAGPDRGLSES